MSMRATGGIDALTEREKQTLRLIVRGHDAKSIARRLDLSVHTINERLRDALQKLSVSSSREAARLLLDAEGETPNLLGDIQFGEDPATTDMEPKGVPGRMSRRDWFTIGGIVMTLLLGLLAFAALSPSNVASADSQPAAIETQDPNIIDTARRFVELGDRGEWANAYRMTAASFQKQNSVARWSEVSKQVRPPLGAMRSRVLIGEQTLPAPPSGYEVVKFRTDFGNKAGVVETVTLENEGGAWKVAGIMIG